jgi:8-oxo-dGTP pyrophosphatase MutT (NUDIX family)
MIDDTTLESIRARLSRILSPPTEHRQALLAGNQVVGRMNDERAARLARFEGTFVPHAKGLALHPRLESEPARSEAMAEVARTLAAGGLLTAWRDELYAVAAGANARPCFHLERAAARYFGIVTRAAHVNGLVGDGGEVRMWIARRSDAKAIDPGQLDNLVGGGVRAGTSIAETVAREAWEEAGIAPALMTRCRPAGTVKICRAQPDGVQREIVYVHDVWLPPGYAPSCVDGEAVAHRLVDLAQAASLIAHTAGADVVTADASLVILDCLFRLGAIAPDSPHFLALAELRWPPLEAETRL